MAVDMITTICTCALGHNEVSLQDQQDGTKTCSVQIPAGALRLLPGCPHGGDPLCTGVTDHKEYNDLVAAHANCASTIQLLETSISRANNKIDKVTAEKDELYTRLTTASQHNISLTEQVRALGDEKDAAVARASSLATERDQLSIDRASLESQVQDLTRERSQLSTDKADLESQVRTLRGQYDTLVAEHAQCGQPCPGPQVHAEYTDLQSRAQTLEEEKANLEQRVQFLTTENKELIEQLQASPDTEGANEALHLEVIAQLEQQVQTLEGEKANLEQQVQTLEGEKANLEQQVQTLEGEKANLEQQVQTLEGEKANLEQQVRALEAGDPGQV